MMDRCHKNASLDMNILKNYRPVSNLPFVTKVLECVVASQLKAYMDTNDLHDLFQSAYKTAHSTESALLKVENANLVLSVITCRLYYY